MSTIFLMQHKRFVNTEYAYQIGIHNTLIFFRYSIIVPSMNIQWIPQWLVLAIIGMRVMWTRTEMSFLNLTNFSPIVFSWPRKFENEMGGGDKNILKLKACAGWSGPKSDRGPALGNWTRAQMYGRDILRGLNNWAVGWTDWNLCGFGWEIFDATFSFCATSPKFMNHF